MTTNNIRELLPTLISRVRIIKFSPVSSSFLKEKLTELYPEQDPKIIEEISLFALGKTGKAIHLMENPDSLANYQKVYRDVQNFLEMQNITDRFLYAENLVEDPAQIDVFFNILAHVLRTKMLNRPKNSKKIVNLLSKIDETAILLKKNINPRLALENLMLEI